MEKKLRFEFGVLGPWDYDWGMFCLSFDDVIIPSNEPMWLKFFWILGYNANLQSTLSNL